MQLTPKVLREFADQMEAAKVLPPVASLGQMTLAECGRKVAELLPDRNISVAVEVDFSPSYGPSIPPSTKINVKLWDGNKFHEAPTLEAAYEKLRLANLPAETRPEVADAMIEDLRAEPATAF